MPGILVTGGAGFIGSHIVDELLTQRYQVMVLDNFTQGNKENLSRWLKHPNLEIIRGDITDFDLVRRCADHKEAIFHLAADSRIQTTINSPIKAIFNNVLGTVNVLEAARVGGVKRVIYSASSSAYGRNKVPSQENMIPDCLNPYSLSKKNGEELMQLFNQLYGLSTVSLRYFNVFGPRAQEEGDYATVISIFRRQKRLRQKLTIVGSGAQRRDFSFIGDIVTANMLALMNREAVGVFNIGTGNNYSILEVAKLIDPTENFEFLPPRQGEAENTLADNQKAREVLGWIPKVNLKQGLSIIDKYEENFPPGRIKLI